jgi:hypothetical protein
MLLVGILIVLLVVVIGTVKGHSGSSVAVDPTTGRPLSGTISGSGSFQYGGPGGDTAYFVRNDTRMNIGKDLENVLEGTGIALLFAGFAIGASFVGAEFNVGSLTTQLLFEPRRERVHAAKATAVAIGTASFALAIMVLVAASMYIGSAARGVVQGVDGTFVVHRVAEALRIAAAVGAGATMAYCVTLVTRRSSAGMIAFYLQYPLMFILDPARMPFGLISHYEPLRGLAAIVLDPVHATGPNERSIHTIAGGVVLTIVWLIVIVSGSGFWFGRAEVR